MPPRQVRPDLPRGLERIILKALAAEAEARYRSAADLERALRCWLRRQWVALGAALLPPAKGRAERVLPAAYGLVAGLWILVFALLPLVNRDHLRAGDLVAGTMVVRAPPMLLLDDLGAARGQPALQFRVDQLDIYGAYELQTLEAVLRLGNTLENAGALAAVAEQIQKRINARVTVAGACRLEIIKLCHGSTKETSKSVACLLTAKGVSRNCTQAVTDAGYR